MKLPVPDDAPIYIAGRQHCGNTMLASILNRHPDVRAFAGEDTFFEHVRALEAADPEARVERVVRELAFGADPALASRERQRLTEALRDDVRTVEGSPSARALYATGKNVLARQDDTARWAQKATSYVFHVDAVLDTFPRAKIIFLVRNPLDLAASMRRRGVWTGVGRTLWGWNAGVRRALEHRTAYPDRFRVVRYEDLVSSPEVEARQIFAFCNLSFSPEFLNVAHVNRSEEPYTQDSASTGLTASRVFYYPDVLAPGEVAAIRLLASSPLLDELYPDLPSPSAASAPSCLAAATQIALSGLATMVHDHGRRLVDDPLHTLRRIGKRLST